MWNKALFGHGCLELWLGRGLPLSPYLRGVIIQLLRKEMKPQDSKSRRTFFLLLGSKTSLSGQCFVHGCGNGCVIVIGTMVLDPWVSIEAFFDAPVVNVKWKADRKSVELVRFGLLWKIFDLVGQLGVSFRCPILEDSSGSERSGPWLLGGVDGTSFLVSPVGLFQPKAGKGVMVCGIVKDPSKPDPAYITILSNDKGKWPDYPLLSVAPLSERRQRLYCQIIRSLEARFIFLSSKKSQRRQKVDLVNLRLFQEWWSPLLWEENCHRAIVLNSVQGSTKTGQHSQQGRTGEDEGPLLLKDAEDNTGPKLRGSTRVWKPNPKCENSAYAVMKGEVRILLGEIHGLTGPVLLPRIILRIVQLSSGIVKQREGCTDSHPSNPEKDGSFLSLFKKQHFSQKCRLLLVNGLSIGRNSFFFPFVRPTEAFEKTSMANYQCESLLISQAFK
ncbi:unnamed protein product [Ilex paraguariensis]|uniref:Maturase n=1 Tax=Ilex paraguariensis TaxID=185542 RepID=A0ABC8TG18_9AQUA